MAGRNTDKEEDDILGRILSFSALRQAPTSGAPVAAAAAGTGPALSKQAAGQEEEGGGSRDAGTLLLKAKLKRKVRGV